MPTSSPNQTRRASQTIAALVGGFVHLAPKLSSLAAGLALRVDLGYAAITESRRAAADATKACRYCKIAAPRVPAWTRNRCRSSRNSLGPG
jgi:hypothetical protein